MVQFCIVQKYSIDIYPGDYDEYFMFYDTISDHPLFFNGEFLFKTKNDFLFYADKDSELERYTGKIPVRFGGDNGPDNISPYKSTIDV